MSENSIQQDPRTYFAAERTFLAWIRTGLALMGVGFAVSRFGLFLRQLGATSHLPLHSTGVSLWSGIGLVLIGVVVTIFSIVEHIQLIAKLRAGNWQPGSISMAAVVLATMLTLVGVGMAAYLLVIR